VEINLFIYLGLIFGISFLNRRFALKFKIPEVTGYVLLGVVLGKSLLNILDIETVEQFHYLSSIALGIIAFSIGIELKWKIIKKLGKSIIYIVILESMGAFIIVFISLELIFKMDIYMAILLGSVASATAPAATVAVIRQYKAKGSLTSTILAVVGIDDAAALIIYVIASNFSKSLILGNKVDIAKIIQTAVIAIIFSIIIGIIFALIYILLLKKIRDSISIQILLVGFIILLLGICEYFQISELLAIMVFGATITNLSPVITKKSEAITEFFTPIFLAVFFILGGAHLDISVVNKIGLMGLVYFIARSIGKIGGASLGAKLGKAPEKIQKYIGFALLPQVGVALALALSIKKDFSLPIYGQKGKEVAIIVINILLFTTIITEVIGPFLTKYVLQKSGEIKKEVK